MVSCRIKKCLLLLFVLSGFCCTCAVHGDLLHLKDGQNWEDISTTSRGKYLASIARFKQYIASGDSRSAISELETLKEALPDLLGPDFEVFKEAEVLYAEGKWFKAVDKYTEVLEKGGSESVLYDTALERQFSLAIAFLNGEKRKVLKVFNLSAFEEGEVLMYSIAERRGNAPISRRALVALARAFEKRGEFADAFLVWEHISSVHQWSDSELGTSPVLEKAQSKHSEYSGPNYDHSSLRIARDHYINYKLISTPEEVAEKQIDSKLNTIDEQLAYKQYSIGEYYDRTGSGEGAREYYDYVISKWPNTSAAEMARARIEAEDLGIRKQESEPSKLRRKLFNASNVFVDNWFGLSFLKGNKK